MKKHRLTAMILAALLLISGTLSAEAIAGTAEDPLVSRSYAEGTYTPHLLSLARTAIERAIISMFERINAEKSSVKSLKTGGAAALQMGAGITHLSGSARLSVTGGQVINVTTGQIAPDGSRLSANNRYIAAENTTAVITYLTDGSCAVDGGARITSVGETLDFSDVPSDYWAYNEICELSALGLINGTGGNNFSPEVNMTRSGFVTLIGRHYGVDTSKYPGSMFPDVSAGQYYAPYVNWAVENNLIDSGGTGAGLFSPDVVITRQEMAVLTVNYANFSGKPLPAASENKFPDDADIAVWASSGVYICAAAGIITGKPGNLADPMGSASRSEVCTIVIRLIRL
jgi:hypothetical protein